MKLDRNINPDGGGKYALVNMRRYREAPDPTGAIQKAFALLQDAGVIDLCLVGTPSEFFPMKLRDVHAFGGLMGYANSAIVQDAEYAGEIYEMAKRAGKNSPFCKKPD